MKLMRAMLCAVILGAFSIPAVASPAKAKKPTPTKVKKAKKAKKSKKARKGKTRLATKGKKSNKRIKKYDFDGDTLEGDGVIPDGTMVEARTGVSFSNLIKFRTSFLPEITKAGEDL